MHELRLARLWGGLGWLWVVLIVWLSLRSVPLDRELGIDFNDKLGHLAAYGLVTFWFCLVYAPGWVRVRYALAMLLLGLGLEYLQGFGGTRQFEWADMLANAIGVLLGLGLGATPLGRGLARLERRFDP